MFNRKHTSRFRPPIYSLSSITDSKSGVCNTLATSVSATRLHTRCISHSLLASVSTSYSVSMSLIKNAAGLICLLTSELHHLSCQNWNLDPSPIFHFGPSRRDGNECPRVRVWHNPNPHPKYRVAPEPESKVYSGGKLTPTPIGFGFFHPNPNPQ
jgi:hypothetical protein